MRNRMINDAWPNGWEKAAATWLKPIWKPHGGSGYVFVGTKNIETGKWEDHAFQLPISKMKLVKFFRIHPRELFDLYFCTNSFDTDRRKSEHARKTPYACVDIDEAPLAAFSPPPTISWETSPGRTQAIWAHNRHLEVQHAEQISKDLAYTYGADKNGWSVTKYLRIPYTYNHKRDYDRPLVRLIDAPSDYFVAALEPPEYKHQTGSKTGRSSKEQRQSYGGSFNKKLASGSEHRRRILKIYRYSLTLMPRALLGHERLLYPDRSSAIFVMVAGLYEAGATRDEIDIALWNSVYFLDKYGEDRWALETEVSRIIGKLEGKS